MAGRIGWVIVAAAGLVGTLLVGIAAMSHGSGPRALLPVTRTVMGLASELESFHEVYERYPSQEEGLAVLVHPSLSDGREVRPFASEIGIDAWGRTVQYRNPSRRGGRVEVFSLGADGIADTEDDVWAAVGHAEGEKE